MTVDTTVTVRVPAKVNLQLAVGPGREDGFHDLVNVFHAVSLFDEVTVKDASVRRSHALTELTADGDLGAPPTRVPLDASNLAARAAELLARTTGRGRPVDMHLSKHIPVAGGMAGGSADAAAALVACDRLWGPVCPEVSCWNLRLVWAATWLSGSSDTPPWGPGAVSSWNRWPLPDVFAGCLLCRPMGCPRVRSSANTTG